MVSTIRLREFRCALLPGAVTPKLVLQLLGWCVNCCCQYEVKLLTGGGRCEHKLWTARGCQALLSSSQVFTAGHHCKSEAHDNFQISGASQKHMDGDAEVRNSTRASVDRRCLREMPGGLNFHW